MSLPNCDGTLALMNSLILLTETSSVCAHCARTATMALVSYMIGRETDATVRREMVEEFVEILPGEVEQAAAFCQQEAFLKAGGKPS